MDAVSRGHSYDTSRSPDTMYGTRAWTDRPKYSYLGPFSSNEERLQQQALASMEIPTPEISQVVRPPLPQINQFPPRYGYRTTALGMDDVANITRLFPTNVSWISGDGAYNSYGGGYDAASRNTLGAGV